MYMILSSIEDKRGTKQMVESSIQNKCEIDYDSVASEIVELLAKSGTTYHGAKIILLHVEEILQHQKVQH